MKLLISEGYNDLQFFKSYFIKSLNGKDITKNENKLVSQFKNLLAENPERAKVEVLIISKEKLLLLGVGTKNNFEIVAKGMKPLVKTLEKEREKVSSMLFIADKDAEKEVKKSVKHIKRLNIDVSYILYNDYLEDLIFDIINLIENKLNECDRKILEKILKIIEEHYKDDKSLKKRKVSLIHGIIGPRCFGHLFDNMFRYFESLDDTQKNVDILISLKDWLKK